MLDVVSSIIQVISWGYVVVQLKDKKINIKSIKNICLVLLMVIFSYMAGTFNTGFSKTIIIYSAFTLCYKYIYNISFQESAILNFFGIGLHFIGELLFVFIIALTEIDGSILEKYLYLTPLSGLLIFIMVIIVNQILKAKLKKIISVLMDYLSTNVFYIVIILCLSIVFSSNINNWKDKNLISNLLIAAMFGLIIVFWIAEKFKVSLANKNFNQLFDQLQGVSSSLMKYRKMNHESKNDLRVLKGMANSNEDIQEYIDEIFLENNIIDNDNCITEFSKINDPKLIKFLSTKINEMIDNNIKVIVNISNRAVDFNFKKLKIAEYKDLCRVLGVYLDNAYEASKNSEEKEVTIEINIVENNLEIVISNSFSGNIDIDSLGKIGYTTKGDEHGTGLSIVKDIISKNKFISQKTTVINNFFYQYLYLEKIS